MVEQKQDLKELLSYIDPGSLAYQDWLAIGMALKDEGYPVETWDDWSGRDLARYKSGECARKWRGFHGAVNPVTAGTIVQLAKEGGWRPAGRAERALEWDDVIGGEDDELVVVDKNWIEGKEIPEPKAWNPAKELITYLETLFEASENVGYVTQSWEKDGKYLPTSGCWDRTAGKLIEQLSKCKGDIGSVIGDYNAAAGAWIRFNPLDGNGVKNENVTEFRYALVESDSTDIAKQNAIIHEIELPVAVLVHSGNKSIHAIVKIGAANYEEYRKRVDYLYTVCKKNGLEIDSANRNPSRLSRMPGIVRGEHKQFIIATNIGKPSWDEWHEWIEGVNDDLPDPENMASVWDSLPELAPPLIDGVLRQGHKMLLAGPSKAGKSYALIELCAAIAEGRRWLKWQCAQGKVLYVNLELDRASCLHRFKDVYDALHWEPKNLKNIVVWNLRGKSIPMDKLAPKLIRRAAKEHYIAIVIDPIYKVITGDENSADQMAHFCNQFDKVCTDLGCAVIYCHHHSKGVQGQKRSMDRASGSGVFARDPDALLDYIELETTEALIAQEENRAISDVCRDFLNRYADDWEDHASQDDCCSARSMQDIASKLLSGAAYQFLQDKIAETKVRVKQRTAWRIDGTLREFPKFDPVNLWFNYPVHEVDVMDSLRDIDADGAQPPWKKATKRRKENAKNQRKNLQDEFDLAVFTACAGCAPTVKDLVEYFDGEKSEKTIYRYIKDYGYTIDRNSGEVHRDENHASSSDVS